MNVIAADVGTTSVRVAIISFKGVSFNDVNVIESWEEDIEHYQDGFKFEQSSQHIWDAVCIGSKRCIANSNIPPQSIRSIAFSATCSLVIDETKDDCGQEIKQNDVIMWMDHRAINEAKAITASGSEVLQQFGGVCSPEFSLAKLLWLKNNDPTRLERANSLFELPDWLVHRCVGGGQPTKCGRSICCVTCKWGYNADKSSHCDIVGSLSSDIWDKITKETLGPGAVAGRLSMKSADDLGLKLSDSSNPGGVIVATSLIDAHAGMLAMLSVPLDSYDIHLKIDSTFCSLVGTSSCHMLLSTERNFVHGIWGPYKDVVLQGYYLSEAGQSLTGKLIENCIKLHDEGRNLLSSGESMKSIIQKLNDKIIQGTSTSTTESLNDKLLASNGTIRVASGTSADSRLHILPFHHGNRSPLANPRLMGGIYGFTADGGGSLLDHYIAIVESIVYEKKMIIEKLSIELDVVLVSGGLMKNRFYMQTLADVLSRKVVKMGLKDIDFMVMGAALVARHAALLTCDPKSAISQCLTDASIQDMRYCQLDIEIFLPREERKSYHEKKYRCFREFVRLSQCIDKILHEE